MKISYFNSNFNFTIEHDNYAEVKELVEMFLKQTDTVTLPQNVHSISNQVPTSEPQPVVESQLVATEPVVEEVDPNPEIKPVLAPTNQDEYYKLLETIKISSPKECRGKYFSLVEYFKFWDDEKQVNEFITNLENNRDIQLVIKNPANHLRWIFHIICTITEHYKFFDSKRLIEKREHYHRLRTGYNLKKAESRSVE